MGVCDQGLYKKRIKLLWKAERRGMTEVFLFPYCLNLAITFGQPFPVWAVIASPLFLVFDLCRFL